MCKIDLSSFSLEELNKFFFDINIPQYHALQIFKWFSRGVSDFSEMTDLSKDFREYLIKNHTMASLQEVSCQTAGDGTKKYLFKLHDGFLIETVVMKYKYGNSVCISSQAGCLMGCSFCASTIKGKERDLTAGEMLLQVAYANKKYGISHVVVMGVGEPLDNYDNLIKFLNNVTDKEGLNISARHISVSTCGLVDRIYELAEHEFQITLSISLHAPDDETRQRLMPVNKKYNISQLLTACRYYMNKTNRRISFEYILIKDINDSEKHAKALSVLLKAYLITSLVHVNLIPVNFVEERGLLPSSPKTTEAFLTKLQKDNINATIRRKLGEDIDASCGQLRLKQ